MPGMQFRHLGRHGTAALLTKLISRLKLPDGNTDKPSARGAAQVRRHRGRPGSSMQFAPLAGASMSSTEYDIPYFAGHSVDEHAVFNDRHLRRTSRWLLKTVRSSFFLLTHEIVETATCASVASDARLLARLPPRVRILAWPTRPNGTG